MWANDPVSNELNKIIVSSKSQMNTRSTVLSTSSELPPFWLFLLVLQLLFPALIVPPLPELRFLESFFRAAIKIRDYDYIYDISWNMATTICSFTSLHSLIHQISSHDLFHHIELKPCILTKNVKMSWSNQTQSKCFILK